MTWLYNFNNNNNDAAFRVSIEVEGIVRIGRTRKYFDMPYRLSVDVIANAIYMCILNEMWR